MEDISETNYNPRQRGWEGLLSQDTCPRLAGVGHGALHPWSHLFSLIPGRLGNPLDLSSQKTLGLFFVLSMLKCQKRLFVTLLSSRDRGMSSGLATTVNSQKGMQGGQEDPGDHG